MRYVAIRSEGGLIPYDLLDKIANEDIPGQKPADFGLPKGRRLTDEISRVWSDAQSLWDILRRRRESLSEKDPYGTTLTRDRWMIPLLSDAEMLGFDLKLQPAAAVVGNLTFPVSHRSGDGDDAIPVHIEGLKIDLDRRLHTKLRTSPQAMVQEFLNHSESLLWGVVTNGLTLRLLRDSSRVSRPTYLEFDLESILDGNRFAEFALFYRLCHRSRFPRPGQDPSKCLLEDYYQQSIDEGSRVREGLRIGVEETLRIFGNAFLQHPANSELREKITGGRLNPVQYHRQLLLLVYRLLFLMVAEERRLIVSQGDGAERNQRIYDESYSVTHLRDRAANIIEESSFTDLWVGLLQTFSLFEYGLDSNPLGIPPLNGDLFHQSRAIPDLSGTQLHNHELLRAARHLSMFKAEGLQQRVNYSALDVEDLGSVYESLLDYQPVIELTENGLRFDLPEGAERKRTGSYYTRPELVHELIESALVPVLQDRIAKAEKESEGNNLEEEKRAKIKAILSMSVCDPACGSGHFLLAAARRLGKELARIKTGEDEPRPEDFHLAVREVIQHCIYGVDLNPLAVDLCKLAMWLEGHWAGKPLSFLDNRIRCGNSLIGVFDPAVLAEGIPDDAFSAVTLDDQKVSSYFKKRNKQERTSKQRGFSFDAGDHGDEYAKANRELADITEDTASAVRRKAELYSSWRAGMQHSHDEAVADLWTAQFFVPLTRVDDPAICTTKDFFEFSVDKQKKPQQVAAAQAKALQSRFFHWHLEFPEVVSKGGFDIVLGNPPWDVMQLGEEEYFTQRLPEVGKLGGAERKRAIAALESGHPAVYATYLADKRSFEVGNKFAKESGRFNLTAHGKINTYALFAELCSDVASRDGRAGIIIPTAIATGDTTKLFFNKLVTTGRLVSCFNFFEIRQWFPDTDDRNAFGLLTLGASNRAAMFAFLLTDPAEMSDRRRIYALTASDIANINPDTKTAPMFRTSEDAACTAAIYRTSSEGKRPLDWMSLKQNVFTSSSADDLAEFARTKESDETSIPIFRGSMFHQYDAFFAKYEIDGFTSVSPFEKSVSNRIQADKCVSQDYYERRMISKGIRACYHLAIRRIARSADERTLIAAMLPNVGADDTASMIVVDGVLEYEGALLANLNSLIFDYACAQKIGGTDIRKHNFSQLPILSPTLYSELDLGFIVPRILELSYTNHALASFARDLRYDGPPFVWDEARRARLRAELDAYYAHLYRLTRDDLRYVLDPKEVFGEDFPSETFRVLKEGEMKEHGEYRTQRLVLEAFDKLAESPRFRDEMPKRVSAFEVPTKKRSQGAH